MLCKARYWGTDRAVRFKEEFCRPKHQVRTIQSTATTQTAFSVTKEDTGSKVMVTTFLGREDDISEAVEQIQVKAILFHAVQSKAFKIPAHVLGLVESGVSLLVWGRPTMVDRVVTTLRKAHPLKVFLPITLYQRPETPLFNHKYRTVEHSSCLVADEGSIQGQVYLHKPPSLHLLIFRDARLHFLKTRVSKFHSLKPFLMASHLTPSFLSHSSRSTSRTTARSRRPSPSLE
jgi:hypothetical protein